MTNLKSELYLVFDKFESHMPRLHFTHFCIVKMFDMQLQEEITTKVGLLKAQLCLLR